MRTSREFYLKDPSLVKTALLQWSRQYKEIAWLDSNEYDQHHHSFDAILAVAAFTALKTDSDKAFDKLAEYQDITGDWVFGYLSYDLKNDVEDLTSDNYDGLQFPELYFFQPQKLFLLKGNLLELQFLRVVDKEIESDFEAIMALVAEVAAQKKIKIENSPGDKIQIRSRITKEVYLEKVNEMLMHIHRGDIYEANFCQEFFADGCQIDAMDVFSQLNEISMAPFAVYLKLENHYLLSASPERYLKKTGKRIFSQPIKGTARRSKDPWEDKNISMALEKDEKERSENIMIVDLVRNDLSKIAAKGSVVVEEMCKIYTFKQVHQMISTVSATLEKGISPVEVLRSTFPMGSMTGAPKISAMKIIEELEATKRGLYSGAVGYFSPDGDFDFNVVIRSILYNAERKYVSFSVGSAITSRSIPAREFEECILKAGAMMQALDFRP